MEETDRLCSYSEAAVRLGVSPDTVRRLVVQGELRIIRIGNAVRIPASDIEGVVRRGAALTREWA